MDFLVTIVCFVYGTFTPETEFLEKGLWILCHMSQATEADRVDILTQRAVHCTRSNKSICAYKIQIFGYTELDGVLA
jgi:hypothetical protein